LKNHGVNEEAQSLLWQLERSDFISKSTLSANTPTSGL